ncbi:MAG TPA: NfeD family protein [Firmicutes bacterium]|nr:NfeD family protein [Bacillota bacterium]
MLPFMIIWVVAFIIFCIVEVSTVQLVSIWFAVGSLGAFLAALFQLPFWAQLLIFVLISGVLVLITRPLAKKLLSSKRIATNADRIIGLEGVVTESIHNGRAQGRVRVDGMSWSARSIDGVDISEGAEVIIRSIEGVKVIVEPKVSIH